MKLALLLSGLATPVCGALFFAGHSLAAMTVGALVGVAAIVISPLFGVCLVAMSLPLAGLLQLLPGAFTGSKALALLLAITYLPRLFNRRLGQLFASQSLRRYLFFTGCTLVALPLAAEPGVALLELSVHIQMLGLMLLVATIPRDLQQVRKLCLWATIGSGILGIYVAVFGVDSLTRSGSDGRLSAGTNENALAFAISVGLILSAVAWQGASRATKVMIIVLDLLAVANIGLTASRAAWVALAVCVGGSVMVVRRVRFKKRLAFLLTGSLLGGLGLMLVLTDTIGSASISIEQRLSGIVEEPENVTSGRLESIWPTYVSYFFKSPVLGNGLGLSRKVGAVSHNDWLKVAAEQGIFGLLFFGFMYVAFIREAMRIQDDWLRVVMIALILFVTVFGLFHNTLLLKSYPLAIGVLACLANIGMCEKSRAQGVARVSRQPG